MEKKAIILVAGMGTRLKPRTLTTHKCLTKINGIPILKNALKLLADAGVSETLLVVGYLGNEIKQEIGDNFNGMLITYTENEIYADTNTSYSLKIGMDSIGSYDILYVLEGDVFFEPNLLKRLMNDEHSECTLVEPYEPRLDGSFVTLGEDGFVQDWTHKTMREPGYTLEGKYKTINIHKFSRDFIDNTLYPAIKHVCEATNGKSPIENVMRDIVRDNNRVIFALTSDGNKWFEIDDENDLKIAEKMFQ